MGINVPIPYFFTLRKQTQTSGRLSIGSFCHISSSVTATSKVMVWSKETPTLFQTHSCCCSNGKTITANLLCLYTDEKQQNKSKPTHSCICWSSNSQQQWLISTSKHARRLRAGNSTLPQKWTSSPDPTLAVLQFGVFAVVVFQKLNVLACRWHQHLPRSDHFKAAWFSRLHLETLHFPLNEPPPGPSHWIPAQSKWYWATSLHPLPSYLQTVLIPKPRCCNYRYHKFLKRPTVASWDRTLEQVSLQSTDTFWY